MAEEKKEIRKSEKKFVKKNFDNKKKFESIKYDTVSNMIEEFFLKKASQSH